MIKNDCSVNGTVSMIKFNKMIDTFVISLSISLNGCFYLALQLKKIKFKHKKKSNPLKFAY